MELRNHQLMAFHGVRNWPAIWRTALGTPAPTGEIGTLDHVQFSTIDPGTCIITMFHDGYYYVGRLSFDNNEFSRQICELLKANFGRSLVDIGSIDIP